VAARRRRCVPGGRRNWDLRYSFVRESAWALRALYALGFAWEADDFLSFLVNATSTNRPLKNFFRVNGDDPPEEIELAHLTGYDGARPVRVGNAAARYSQHDVPGALLDAAVVPALARRQLSSSVWGLVRREVENVVGRWDKPDRAFSRRARTHDVEGDVLSVDRGAWFAELRGRPSAGRAGGGLRRVPHARRGGPRHLRTLQMRHSPHHALVGFLPRRTSATVLTIERELSWRARAWRRTQRRADRGRGRHGPSWWLSRHSTTIGAERARARRTSLAYGGRLTHAEHIDPPRADS
jgi:hypothetical protein